MSDEDAAMMLAKCPRQVVRERVGLADFGERHDTRTNGPHYTAADRWPTPISEARGKLNGGKVARHARHPHSIFARMSRVSTRMSRGCYEETAPLESKRMPARSIACRDLFLPVTHSYAIISERVFANTGSLTVTLMDRLIIDPSVYALVYRPSPLLNLIAA